MDLRRDGTGACAYLHSKALRCMLELAVSSDVAHCGYRTSCFAEDTIAAFLSEKECIERHAEWCTFKSKFLSTLRVNLVPLLHLAEPVHL